MDTMKRRCGQVILLDLVFLALLIASSLCRGILSDLLYYTGFLLPIGIGLFLIRGRPGIRLLPEKGDGGRFAGSLAFFAPTVGIVLLLSFLTSRILTHFGYRDEVSLSGNFALDLLLHALVPAILEETLLRYIPLRTLGENKRAAVLLSALFFALIHVNLFRIPYAFAAGLCFALIDLYAGSILPSLLLHALNNALSLLWAANGESPVFRAVFLSALALLCAGSVVWLILRRKKYLARFREIFAEKSKLFFPFSAILFAFLTLILAVTFLGTPS